jgi:putative transposase
MPRHARLRLPGLPLHVIQRGNDKLPCFREDRDHRVYLRLLDELSGLCGCDIHAYVLMTNHVHMLMTPIRTDGPSLLMKRVGQRFAQYVNRKYDRSGSLFEGRFRSCIVDTEGYMLRCQRYIEMNPVRAGMVTRPADYAWSSYRANAHGEISDFIVPHPLYVSLAASPEERRTRYRSLFDSVVHGEELRQIRDAVNSGAVLGRDEFIHALGECFAVRAVKGRPGRPARTKQSASAVPPKRKRGLSPI